MTRAGYQSILYQRYEVPKVVIECLVRFILLFIIEIIILPIANCVCVWLCYFGPFVLRGDFARNQQGYCNFLQKEESLPKQRKLSLNSGLNNNVLISASEMWRFVVFFLFCFISLEIEYLWVVLYRLGNYDYFSVFSHFIN